MTDNKSSLVLGIDEAGRGAVIGPLVVGGVLLEKRKLKFLTRMGIKDSKRLTRRKRQVLSRKVNKISKTQKEIIDAKTIDKKRSMNINLNDIEFNAMTNIIESLKPDICYIDCIDIDEDRFHNNMQKLFPDIEFITEHNADDTYVIVSAASIIAKVERDKQIEIIKNEYGKIGSGYPSDKNTINFLKTIEIDKYPDVVRTSWNTIEKIKLEKNH